MNYTVRAFITGFAFLLMPFASQAADSAISNVTVSPSDTLPGATDTLTVSFTTTGIAFGGHVAMSILETDGVTLNDDFDFSSLDDTAVLTASTSLSSYTSYIDTVSNWMGLNGTYDFVMFHFSSELPAGTYTMVIPGIVNPAVDTNYTVGVTTVGDFEMETTSNFTVSSSTYSIATPPEFDRSMLTGLKIHKIKKHSALLRWPAYSVTYYDVNYEVDVYSDKKLLGKIFRNIVKHKKKITEDNVYFLESGKPFMFKVRACRTDVDNVCTKWSLFKNFTMKAAD